MISVHSEKNYDRVVELLKIIEHPFAHVTADDAETDWPEGGPIRRAVCELREIMVLDTVDLDALPDIR